MKPWLFSRGIDLTVFGLTALVALGLVAVLPHEELPEWTWIAGVLLVDVAHVWSTVFVVYLDPVEWRRRPLLYGTVPVACFAAGVMIYGVFGEALFWRLLAYLAVFHFVRQQYGWVAIYRARAGEPRTGRPAWIDTAAIYAATIYPLIAWHAAPQRAFAWMREGDFVVGIPAWIERIAFVLYLAILGAYVARAAVQRPVNWGKHLIVATTAACWYVGIVATNSDYAFTVTNVFIHGIPYLVLVYIYARRANVRALASRAAPLVFLGALWIIAYAEELVWDRGVWHEREWMFGQGFDNDWSLLLVPLLATPQLSHYVLDGWLWKRSRNPRVATLL